jgi:hypothetical protein
VALHAAADDLALERIEGARPVGRQGKKGVRVNPLCAAIAEFALPCPGVGPPRIVSA